MGRDQSAGNPGCNVTGISTKSLDLGSKWVELHELLPAAKRFAVLANIANADSARSPVTRHVYFDAVRVSVTSQVAARKFVEDIELERYVACLVAARPEGRLAHSLLYHLPELVQRAQIIRPWLVSESLRPVGPRHLADIEVAVAVHRKPMRRQELG